MVHRIGAETLPIGGTSAGDAMRPVDSKPLAWRFDGFEFDLRRGELHGRDGTSIALRPRPRCCCDSFWTSRAACSARKI